MKTIYDLLKQEPVYLNQWKESKKFGVVADFEGIYITPAEYEAKKSPYFNEEYWEDNVRKMKKVLTEWEDINILFASYGQANYSGEAWVLFEENGELYEVNGSHCSCYGLEGQWEDKEPVVLKELKNRLERGTFGTDDWADNNFAEELKQFLGV